VRGDATGSAVCSCWPAAIRPVDPGWLKEGWGRGGASAPGAQADKGRAAVPPPSRMQEREWTAPSPVAEGELSAAAMWLSPSWALRWVSRHPGWHSIRGQWRAMFSRAKAAPAQSLSVDLLCGSSDT